MSYKDCLFEFKIRQFFTKNQTGNEIETSLGFDTIGVYLLFPKEKQYYEFDTFSLQSRLIQNGPFEKKESGMKLKRSDEDTTTDTHYGPLQELKAGIPNCYFADILPNDPAKSKETITQVVLLKQARLLSHYRITGAEYSDKDYCMVGIMTSYPSAKTFFAEKVTQFRELTDSEKQICNHLIATAKAYH